MQMIETRKPTQSFRDWMERQYGTAFEITCEGLLECGGVGGFSGMMTHVETTELYEEFEEEIWEALSEDAEIGSESSAGVDRRAQRCQNRLGQPSVVGFAGLVYG